MRRRRHRWNTSGQETSGGKLDRKVRVAPDFKLKQDVMRTSWRKVNTTNVGVPRASYL